MIEKSLGKLHLFILAFLAMLPVSLRPLLLVCEIEITLGLGEVCVSHKNAARERLFFKSKAVGFCESPAAETRCYWCMSALLPAHGHNSPGFTSNLKSLFLMLLWSESCCKAACFPAGSGQCRTRLGVTGGWREPSLAMGQVMRWAPDLQRWSLLGFVQYDSPGVALGFF